jgi:glycine cleavage system aminomethyltransferase T
VLAAGAQLTHLDEQRRSLGYVTSAAYSPELSQWVGLALLSREVPLDAQVMARDPLRGRHNVVRVTPPVHVDPDGARMKA